MQYINKDIGQIAGYYQINILLENAWNIEENKYFGADYDGLNRDPYRNALLELMILEQQNYCCYCMKRISLSEITIEHVIPQTVTNIDFQTYINDYPIFGNHIIAKVNFDYNNKTIPPDLYPHDIAYHNLIASCNNKQSCNQKRHNYKILPLIFYNDISNRFLIDVKDGIMFSNETLIDETISLKLFLNNNSLKIYRKLWFLVVSYGITLENINNINTIDERIEFLNVNFYSEFKSEISTLSSDYSWNEFLKYDWYFKYFRN